MSEAYLSDLGGDQQIQNNSMHILQQKVGLRSRKVQKFDVWQSQMNSVNLLSLFLRNPMHTTDINMYSRQSGKMPRNTTMNILMELVKNNTTGYVHRDAPHLTLD